MSSISKSAEQAGAQAPANSSSKESFNLALTRKETKALRKLIGYVFSDELKDFSVNTVSDRRGHIFKAIATLAIACGTVTRGELKTVIAKEVQS